MQGQIIAGFELQEHLGEGGAGSVWKARQISLERIVAIKILTDQLADNPADIEQFKLEARAAAQLKHTGIVQVYDFGEDNGAYFFAMEYIKGYSVGDWLERKGQLSESDTLMVAHSIAEALGYAWEKTQLIHRDIKPDNVLVDEDGTIKVVDLGLVKVLNAEGDSSFESENMCTPNYCSPQQAHDEHLDFRTDIYSLGCMMYHMLTGQLPFGELGPHQVLDQQVEGQLADPREFAPETTSGAVLLLQKMLAKDAGARPGSWDEVLLDIQRCMRREMPIATLPPDAVSTVAYDVHFNLAESASASGRIVKVDRERLHSRDTHSRAAHIPPPKKSGAPAAIASILIAVVLVGGGLFALQYYQKAQGRKAVEQREQQVSDAFLAAKNFASEHPDEFDQAIENFERLTGQAAGTRYASQIKQEVKALQGLRNKRIEDVMTSLGEKARKLVANGDFIGAMNAYKIYGGPYKDETRSERDRMAVNLEPRAIQQAEQQRSNLINHSDETTNTNTPPEVVHTPEVVPDPSPEFPPELLPYKTAFEAAVGEANAAYLQEFGMVFAGYQAALAKVKKEGSDNGIQGIVQAVEREEERLSAEGTLPRRLVDSVPASVKVVMARAAQHRARLEATRNGRLDPMKTSYLNQLRAIQRKFTAEERINDARVVKEIADELELKSIPFPKFEG